MTPEETARIIEFGEAEAYADFFRATPADIAAQFGIGVRRFGPATGLSVTAADFTLFNRVMGLGLSEPATESEVDDILAYYHHLRRKNFAIQLSPAAGPAGLPRWLTARGLYPRDNWVKVIRGPEPPPEIQTDLRVAVIGPEHASDFSRVATAAFEMPPVMQPWFETPIGRSGWRCYLAFDGEMPVATGALFIKNQIGWLGIGSTLPSHRGRGAQGAIMAQRIRDGAAYGCRWLITETGEETATAPNPSYHNMLRTGFKVAYMRPNYRLGSER